jgi:hypothetical protein
LRCIGLNNRTPKEEMVGLSKKGQKGLMKYREIGMRWF